MKQFLLIIILIFVFSTYSFSEVIIGSIRGTILDQENGEPMEYVSVAIFTEHDQELITGTITELNGAFNIKNLEKGHYYLEVSFIGYEKKVVEEILIDGSKSSIDLG